MMLPPNSRKGAFGDQKGPRMEEEVGSAPVSLRCLWAISSTRLQPKVRDSRYLGVAGRRTILIQGHQRFSGPRFSWRY